MRRRENVAVASLTEGAYDALREFREENGYRPEAAGQASRRPTIQEVFPQRDRPEPSSRSVEARIAGNQNRSATEVIDVDEPDSSDFIYAFDDELMEEEELDKAMQAMEAQKSVVEVRQSQICNWTPTEEPSQGPVPATMDARDHYAPPSSLTEPTLSRPRLSRIQLDQDVVENRSFGITTRESVDAQNNRSHLIPKPRERSLSPIQRPQNMQPTASAIAGPGRAASAEANLAVHLRARERKRAALLKRKQSVFEEMGSCSDTARVSCRCIMFFLSRHLARINKMQTVAGIDFSAFGYTESTIFSGDRA